MTRTSIQLLDEHLINLIAAGEVVENPASCIKELVENSLDAQSTAVYIEIQKGGFERICIMDNGIGMVKEDAILCFERHATSKLQTQQDLKSIRTLGFRGEALSSIASISHVEMKTAPKEGGEATQIEIKGGKLLKQGPTHREHGTTLEIFSLFFNVPARLEFQKTIKGAQIDVVKMVQKIALSKPKIRFSLLVDKKLELDCPEAFSIEERALSLFGSEWVETMIPIDYTEGEIVCRGLIAKPMHHQKTRGQQFFFINERTASSPYIQTAAYEAYQKHFPPKCHPALIFFLDIPLELVDVNVHPQKSIVRLKGEKNWFRIVQIAIDRALMQEPVNCTQNFVQSPQSQSYYEEPAGLKTDWHAFDFPLVERKDSYVSKKMSPDGSLNKVVFEQKVFIDLSPITIIDHYFIARLNEEAILVDLDVVEQLLAMDQIQNFTKSVQKELISRSVRLSMNYNLEDKEIILLLKKFGIEARFLSKSSLTIDGLAPCMDPLRLEETVDYILQNAHRSTETIYQNILPKMRKGYLKKDMLLSTNAFIELMESKKDLKGMAFVPLNQEALKRCFLCKG
ncbi:MAG: DNA mismatch repair endonuclease MutL [Verrucomicrobia bacterium]|nr:DNA mismatch repair endonuclease MutL [Verrucomicrobiota bacterium]NDE63894.1 DNA mismatch repair endonuclease MutL [Chlamydiota bacterium]